MINIHPITDNTSLILLSDGVWANCVSMRIGIISFPNTCSASEHLGLRPHDTRKSTMGNRSCTHDNWEGDLITGHETCASQESYYLSTTSRILIPVAWTATKYLYDRQNELSRTFEVTIPVGGSGTYILPSVDYKDPTNGACHWNGDYTYYWESGMRLVLLTSYSVVPYKYTWIRPYYRKVTSVVEFGEVDWNATISCQSGSLTALSRTGWPIPYNADEVPLSPRTLVPNNYTGTEENHERLLITKSDLRLASNWLRQYIPADDENLWGDLCMEAIQDAHRVDVNSLEFARDLFELKDSIIALLSLLRGRVKAKSLGKLWLSIRYGLRLTAKDTVKITEAVKRTQDNVSKVNSVWDSFQYKLRPLPRWDKSWNYVRSATTRESVISSGLLQNTSCTQEYHYKVYYDPLDKGFLSLIMKLIDWDVFPTFQNLWDLIPLSFVLDWFVDFEKYFDIVDQASYATWLQVLEVLSSTKTTFHQVPLDKFLPIQKQGRIVIGSVNYSRYVRVVSPYLTIPRLRLETPQEFRNYAELTAIILSQTR